MDNISESIVILENLERQAQEIVRIIFILCEKHQMTLKTLPDAERKALAASVLAVQQSMKAFLALESNMK